MSKSKPLLPEPERGFIEAAYRHSFLEMDIELACLGVGIGIASIVALSYIDYLFFQLSNLFYILLLIRTMFVVFSVIVILCIRRIRRVTFYDTILFIWWLTLFAIIVTVDISRPHSYVQNQLLYVLGAFACYTVIPLPRLLRSIPALALSISALLVLHFLKDPMPSASLQITVASHIIMNIMGILISARLYSFRRRQYTAQQREAEAVHQLEILATTDSLTGLYNRRRFFEMVYSEYCRFQRNKRQFVFLMVDFDHFKDINDHFGHQMGDEVLQKFSRFILEQKRRQDSAGRLGGDEFGILLPETDVEGAIPFIERLLQGCLKISTSGSDNFPAVTISIGASASKERESSIDTLIHRADEALYRAKNLGRNRYEIS